MKVTVEIDCTPDEARAFLGLPDVRPMQAAVMDVLEQQAVQAAGHFAPDAMLKLWSSAVPQLSTQIQEMFAKILAVGGRG